MPVKPLLTLFILICLVSCNYRENEIMKDPLFLKYVNHKLNYALSKHTWLPDSTEHRRFLEALKADTTDRYYKAIKDVNGISQYEIMNSDKEGISEKRVMFKKLFNKYVLDKKWPAKHLMSAMVQYRKKQSNERIAAKRKASSTEMK